MKQCRAKLSGFLLGLCVLCPFLPVSAAGVRDCLAKPPEWYRSAEAQSVVENVLAWQSATGGWPKNTNTTRPFSGDPKKIQGTFDNGATTDELRFLARMINAQTTTVACSNAFLRGLGHILGAQYTNGGWPQYSPPPATKYHRYITFNDNAMVRLMEFLREVATKPAYAFVPRAERDKAQRAFDLGVACILQCQITVKGKLTAWCAQHDEIDLSPRPARTFELASLSGAESVGIVRLLMSLEKPSPEVIRAIDGAVAWLDSAKLTGVRVSQVEAKLTTKGWDKVVVKDFSAKPIWARFYEIESNRPIFAGRDGVKKYSLAEIEYERRNGYSWLGSWPESLLQTDYPAWKREVAAGRR